MTAIHASALQGLSHGIALTRNGLKRWVGVDIGTNLQFKIDVKNSLQQNEWHVPLVTYYTNQRNKCLYSFLSCPTDCTWTHTRHHPDKPALPWNLNINIRLKLIVFWGNMVTCTVSSVFYSTAPKLTAECSEKNKSRQWKLKWKTNKMKMTFILAL